VGADPDRAQENVRSVVNRALDLGINYIDTAPIYGMGRCEELLGRALEGEARPFYLSTKVGFEPEDFDYTRDSVLWSIERSLKRLGVPKLSVAQFHDNQVSWERITAPEGTLEGLRAAQQRGLCEYIGVTGRAIPLLTSLVETGEFDTVLAYHDYHPCSQVAAEDLVPAARAHDTGIVIASVLAGGLFGHRPRREELLASMAQTERRRALDVIECLQEEPGTLARSAFRFVLADPTISTIASGAASVSEIEDVAQASDMGPLSPELIEELRRLP
jgi:L-galactose dehydrogenase